MEETATKVTQNPPIYSESLMNKIQVAQLAFLNSGQV